VTIKWKWTLINRDSKKKIFNKEMHFIQSKGEESNSRLSRRRANIRFNNQKRKNNSN